MQKCFGLPSFNLYLRYIYCVNILVQTEVGSLQFSKVLFLSYKAVFFPDMSEKLITFGLLACKAYLSEQVTQSH